MSDIQCDQGIVNDLMYSPPHTPDSNLNLFTSSVNETYNLALITYQDLHIWSIQNLELFWLQVLQFCKLKLKNNINLDFFKNDFKNICTNSEITSIPLWFPSLEINFAENILKFAEIENYKNKIAIYSSAEAGNRKFTKTWTEFYNCCKIWANIFKNLGIKKGDVIAGYMPNCVETVEASIGATWLGAIWTGTSPDFGAQGVLDRFSQCNPKVLITVDAIWYNGKTHSHVEKYNKVVNGLSDSLICCFVIPFVDFDFKFDQGESERTAQAEQSQSSVNQVIFKYSNYENLKNTDLPFEYVNFNDPLYIMYSSGTTGKPKCMVHSVGGTIIENAKEHIIHLNFGNMSHQENEFSGKENNDCLFFYSTTGWMMWNWLVAGLLSGISIVCYDGSPLKPNINFLWNLVDEFKVTVLGTSPKWLSFLENLNSVPKDVADLSTLKCICSTGSPLPVQAYDYVYKSIKTKVNLASIAGGTDIIGCFFAASYDLPVYRGKLTPPGLGFDLKAYNYDENKKEIECRKGDSGDLVCLKPFPSMPRKFLNDENNVKYKKAYFNKFQNIWTHGDFIQFDQNNYCKMLGRSDATLNPNGVRFGTADLYSIIEDNFKNEILDSCAISQINERTFDERVILFIVLKVDGKERNASIEDLIKKVKVTIRAKLSARHVPSIILPIQDIPYTISGKKVEIAVRNIINEKPAHSDTFRNAACLEEYYELVKSGFFKKW